MTQALAGVKADEDTSGLMLGVGIEHFMTHNINIYGEYEVTSYSDMKIDETDESHGIEYDSTENIVMFGRVVMLGITTR